MFLIITSKCIHIFIFIYSECFFVLISINLNWSRAKKKVVRMTCNNFLLLVIRTMRKKETKICHNYNFISSFSCKWKLGSRLNLSFSLQLDQFLTKREKSAFIYFHSNYLVLISNWISNNINTMIIIPKIWLEKKVQYQTWNSLKGIIVIQFLWLSGK